MGTDSFANDDQGVAGPDVREINVASVVHLEETVVEYENAKKQEKDFCGEMYGDVDWEGMEWWKHRVCRLFSANQPGLNWKMGNERRALDLSRKLMKM